MADRISKIYANACKKGVLNPEKQSEDWFRKQISTEKGQKSFYDFATQNGMKFHPYEEWQQRLNDPIDDQPAQASAPFAPAAPAYQAQQDMRPSFKDHKAQTNAAEEEANMRLQEETNRIALGQEPSAEQKQPSAWQTFYKGIGAGAINTANGLLGFLNRANSAQIANDQMTLQMMAKHGKSPEEIAQAADATRARLDKAENERYDAWKAKADQLSAESKPDGGEKTFTDYISEGKIGKALQLGLGTAAESLPYTASALNPVATAAMIMSMSEQNYRQSLEDNPDMSEGKRIASAVGNAAIEMAVEHIGKPFKVFKAGKLTAPTATKWIKDVVKQSKDNIYKGILRVLGFGAKEAAKEGGEEVITTAGQDLYNTLLDWKDTNGIGLNSQWERAKQTNPQITPEQFALDKAEGLTNDFIGGALSGMMMSGPSTGVGLVQNAKYYSKNGGSEASRTQAQQQLAVLQQLSEEFGVSQEQVAQAIVDYQSEKELTPYQQAIINRGEELITAIQSARQAEQPAQPEQAPKDRQAQLRQQATEAAQQEIQSIAHKDGNVYRVGIKGKDGVDGYAMSGALDIQLAKDGTLSTRGRNLITIKMTDGTVEQVPADEVTLLDDPASAADRVQAVADHLFAQYANNDLFQIGDKVHIMQDGQPIAESSTIVNITDEGVEVEIIDPNGQPNTTVIPHEQAAEMLSKDETGTEDGIVTFNTPDGELRLRQTAEGVYETIAPPYAVFEESDLANMGAVRAETAPPVESAPNGQSSSHITTGENGNEASVAAPAYPTDEEGNPAWGQIEVPQAAQILYDTFKQNNTAAQSYAEDQLKEAEKVQKQAAKQKSHSLNIAQRISEDEQNAAFKAAADAAVKYWQDVKLAIGQIKTAEEQAAKEAQQIAMQQAREQRSHTEEGTTANATMAERYNAAPKIIGNAGTTTLPDGRELAGHYVLIAPQGVTPSHDVTKNFRRSEGYPVTSNGQSINDRDYTSDKEEQQKVVSIAQNFNGNAIKNIPVISDEGLVYNGNGRMMAGQLAAINGTDAAYTQSLMNNAAQYGFTPEQVASIPNARVVFQLDERLPYSTQSLAIFNEQETQTQSNTGKAAGYARKLTPQAISEVLSAVEGFNTIDAFFSDKKAPFNLINSLINAGIIAQREKAEMVDGDKLSATGRERLSNILFGTVFDNDTIRLMGDDAALKNSILRALPQILDNKSLGEFSLESDINDAIRLLYQVRNSGMPFRSFVSQTVIAEDGQVHTAAEGYSPYKLLLAEEMSEGGVDAFRDVLTAYNNEARNVQGGQVDIFGDLLTPTELKNLILQRYGKEPNEQERPSASRQNDNSAEGTPASNEPAAEVTDTPATEEQNQVDEHQSENRSASIGKTMPNDSKNDAEGQQPAIEEQTAAEEEQIFDADELRNQSAETKQRIDDTLDKLISSNMAEIPSPDIVENMSESEAREIVRKYYNGGYAGGFGQEIEQLQKDLHWNYLWLAMADEEEGKPTDWYDNISYLYPQSFAQNVTGSPYKGILRELSTRAASTAMKQAPTGNQETPEARLAAAEAETDTNPTEAQKKAENYKQGHVTLWGLPITIENPKGSIRRGTDANGKQWEQEMHHTYGKIRRTEGVDGDHIDVFIGPNLTSDKVFVVDQRNVDTGEFDEHKCMLGFDSLEDAQNGYLSNYKEGWKGMGTVTEVTMDKFKKWIDSSHRKTKPFAEYKSVKAEGAASTAIEYPDAMREKLADELRKFDMGESSPMDEDLVYDTDDMRKAVTDIIKRYNSPKLQAAMDAITATLDRQRAAGAEWLDAEDEEQALVDTVREVVGDKATSVEDRSLYEQAKANKAAAERGKPVSKMKKDEILAELEQYAQDNLFDMTPRMAKRILSLAKKYGKNLPEPLANMADNAALLTGENSNKVTKNAKNGKKSEENDEKNWINRKNFVSLHRQMIEEAAAENGQTLTDEEKKNWDWLSDNIIRIVDEYKKANGNVLDPDAAREYFSPIGYDGSNVPQYRTLEKALVDALYSEMLDEALAQGKTKLVLLTGHGGAGKSTATRDNKRVQALKKEAGVVFDAAMNSFKSLNLRIQQAIDDHGVKQEDITIIPVYNDAVTSFENTLKRGIKTGRVLSIKYLLNDAFAENVGKLAKVHEKYPKIAITPIDNSENNGGREASIGDALQWDYDVTESLINQILDKYEQYIKKGGLTPNQIATISDGLSDVEVTGGRVVTPSLRSRLERIGEGIYGEVGNGKDARPEVSGSVRRPVEGKFKSGDKVIYKKKYPAEVIERNADGTYILEYPNNLMMPVRVMNAQESDIEPNTPPSGPAPTKPTKRTAKKEEPKTNFESNSVFTADAVAEARKRLAERRNRLNMGLNPEDAYDYTIIAGAYVEQGVRKFADFCKAMIQDLGDAVRPYLQSIYDSLRHDPQVKAQGWQKDFDSHDVVDNFDVDNFDYKERNMPEVRDYKDVNGQDIHIDDVSMSKSDGKLYYELTVTEADGKHQRQTSVSVETFNHELETKGIYSANEQPNEEKPVSPMMKQFQSIKEQYPDATLMFRVGDFYELYEEDAVEASKILGITLTKRKDGRAFAGFPFHALDTYLPKLVRAGKRVAICDQLEDPKKTTKTVKRGVSELVTPGTPYQETPKVENTEVAEPESVTDNQAPTIHEPNVVTDTIGEITESKHTKTGAPIWVVKPLERVSDAEFRVLRRRAKENNGYYSTFVKGYVFNSINDATRFNNISDEQTTTEQTSADSEAAIRAGEAAEREAASVGRDRGDKSRAEGEQRTEVSQASVGAVGTVTPQEQPVLSQAEADAAITERQDAISKIDAATEQIENQLDRLEVSEETTEEQPSQPTVLEQAKQRRAASRKKKAYDQQQLDLFAEEDNNPPIDEQTEPINNEDNGSTEVRNDGERESSAPQGRTAGQPADQNGTLGGSQRKANEGTQSGGVGSRSEQHRVHDGERGLGTAGQRTEQQPIAESERKNTHNFRYDPNDPAPTSPKARYDANMAAIRLLKQLQDEGRQATPEEQRVLAKFTGWGGLGEYFKGEPGTTYYAYNGEKSPYQIIKELLTDEELAAAQLSRNSAYYTPTAIIDQLWNIAERLGFKGGNILEGSAGIGNILAQMPQSISDRSNLQAVEIDDITAGILAQLYPDAETHHSGFEKVDIPNNSQDLVITNVPFVTGLRVHDPKEKDLSKRFRSIHDFCIAKNVRKLRQGGLGIFITTSGTLDSSKDLRLWLNNEGETDVIGAFRLNRDTFGGTSATSDIIVVRKRVNEIPSPYAINVLDTAVGRIASQEQDDGKTEERKAIYNRYFVEHPEDMGGEMGFGFEHGDTRWGGTTLGCYPSPSINQSERLNEWVDRLGMDARLMDYEDVLVNGGMEALMERINADFEALAKEKGYDKSDAQYGAMVVDSKGRICKTNSGYAVPMEGITPTKVKGHEKSEVLTDYNALKAAVEELLRLQSQGVEDEGLNILMKKLNKVYDDFVKKYGYLNRNVSLSFLRNDVQWASMAALENVRETIDRNGKKKVEVTKTDVFSKRVVGVQPTPKAENAKDGVILSVQQYGNVRPDRIAEWLGKPQDEVEKEIIASRLAFRDPQTGNMVVSHEYLSGNVREKLAYAEAHNENGEYDTNIEELRKVIPVDIPAHLIEFNIGSTWIPVELYHEYLKEKFGVDSLQLTHVGSAWLSNEKSWGTYTLHGEKNRSEGVYSDLLQQQIYGHQLMIAAMNNVPVVVSRVEKHYDGSTETITDKVATAACSDKISQIKDDFVEWARGKMQQDPELAERVQKIYNERFNAIVPMLSVDKAFLSPHLPGQNPKYTLYDHQQQAVVRGTTQPIMLAHEVGTGKTITLISTAMEMRRLGTAKKPMIVVQNATTPQFVKEAKDLYPNAKILTVSERDRTKEGRQEFYAKIKYNDWDLIIVPQSVFDMIPDSEARMRDFIQDKIDEKLHAIEAAKEAKVDEKVTKRMERELEALKEDLQNANMSGKKSSGKKSTEKDAKKEAERIANATAQAEEMLDRRTDEVEDFDDMGIDALLIDEAHNYKHLGFATMMTRGVKGIDPSYSKRAAALYLKCQSIYERCGHRNVVFATGTPISNTAAEIWTFMKYLMPKEVLKDNDIYYFDDFVHNFGKINEQLEFATNGKFKANNRFAQYGNVPELMRIWLTCADCVLTREVGQVNDKVPEMEGGKAQDIFLPQSPSLIDIMASVRAELERYEQMSGKEKKENSHIPLTMYGVAKRAAIDPRLVDASAADEPLSKTNKAVEETLRSLKETKKYNGTVAIFCDSYRNLQTGFNLFEDIKAKLVKAGVPAAKIAIIRSEMTDAAKQKIFDAVREGEIRVIMGSTQTLGTGVNIQTRLHTLIHMDAPDRPMDYTQRNGRIIRQGNMHRQWNIPVRVLRFGVEDSLDVTSYQRLKTKAGFIDSIMNGKSMIDNNLENRVLEDVDEGIFDNPVAMLSGSQYALLKSQAERDLRKWQARKQQHDIDQILIASGLKKNASIIEYRKNLIATDEKFLQQLKETFPTGKVTEYNIDGTICHTPEEVKSALKAVNKDISDQSDALRKNGYEGDKRNVGLALQFNGMTFNVNIVLTYKSRWEGGQRAITIDKEVQYTTPTSDHWLGSPTKVLDKLVEHIEQDYLSGVQAQGEINYSRNYIARLQQESELMRQREGKPFEHTAELERAQALVDEYTEKMKAELAEKEAKYANQSSGRKVELNEQDDEEETPEAQITSLDYPQFTNQTEAQQLATAALVEVLNDNTDLDVFLATDEEASQIMGDDNVEFSIRREPAPKKTGIGYKVFYRGKDGKLYPPMVANPNGEATPVGVWLNADAAPVAGESKTGRPQVKAGGKGTQGGSGQLAYRPGWHLGEIPYALQFNRKDENGEKTLFPKDFVWAEVEYAADNDYQEEAMREGVNTSGKFQHSLAGLKHVPTNGFYRYRTNPNPATDPWIITGAMKVNRILTNEEVDKIVRAAGREPQVREAMLTPNGTLYGWAIGDRIYLTKDGLNPNSPIHEYSHIWAKAMMRNNREGWQSIVDIFKGTPFWDEVVNDPNYQGLTTDDAICSEVLARYSGQRGAARMEEWAKEELYEAEQSGSVLRGAKVRRLINRAKKALADFWHWVGTNLFGIKHFDSAEQVADRILWDMLNQTELGDVTGGATEAMISGYTQEKQRTINEWYAAHPRPQYQVGEKLDHYQARLEQWNKEYKQFRASIEQGRTSSTTKVYFDEQQKSLSPTTKVTFSNNETVPSFTPGVRPTPMANETPYEYALRLRQYYQLMRDERLVAEYVAEINNQADAAAKVLKKNTIVRGLLDAAKPIENFQEWMKQRGATITDESNAYTDTFLATGRVTEANEQMQRDIIRPLAKQIAKIIAPDAKTGKSRLDGINIVWHNMDVAGTGSKLDGKALTPREIIGVYCQAKDCAEAIEKGLPDRGAKGFLNNLGMSHDDVIAAVESVIPRAELDELWRLINAATHFALNYDYESGRISEDTHTEFYQREFYVPQRGWRERDESGLITDYEPVGKRGNDPYNAALVKAHGRQSLASDPFAYIMSIDASSIVSSENNKIKQKFLQFCLDNEDLGLQTGAFRVKKYWIMNVIDPETGKIKLDEEGNPMMEVSYVAPSAEDLSHDRTIKELIKKKRKEWAKVNQAYLERQSHGELGPQLEAAYQTKLSKIEQAIEDLEQQMHIAWNATNTNITQRTSDEKKQHEVRVLLDGQEYLIEVQDEKLANAINKKFKQHQEQLFNTSQKMRNATRFMSAVLTQYNPEFAASNFARDFQVALATLTAEHPELVGSFLKNFAACQPAVWQYAFNDKVRDRAVFRDSELGRYLQEYFKAGAATGFSYMQDLKSLRQDFDAMVNESNLRRGIKGAVGVFSTLTEVSETAVRFAGYVSARQKGMGVNEAAYLSKELTTNFDRAGEVADSGWMSWFSFFRATLNGNIKFLKALKKMPLAYSLIAALYVAMGMLNQLLNPDDPEDEVWAGDYTRESNFVIGKWRIPTAHFLRMFFAAGVNAAKWMQGEKSFGEATYNTATFATNELLPDYLDVMNWTDWDSNTGRMTMPWDGDNYKKGVRGFIPTPLSPIADVWANRDFMGATINYPADDGKKDILRAKKKTLPIYQMLTQTIYEGVGGNMNTKRKSDDPAWRSWLFDTSASSVEHVVEGYMPAGMDMFITLGEAIYDAATGTPTGPDKWPFVRKFYNAYTLERAYMQQYYLLNGRVKEFKRVLDDYQKNDPAQYRLLRNSQQYRTYKQTESLVKSQSDNPTTADVRALIEANKLWIK